VPLRLPTGHGAILAVAIVASSMAGWSWPAIAGASAGPTDSGALLAGSFVGEVAAASTGPVQAAQPYRPPEPPDAAPAPPGTAPLGMYITNAEPLPACSYGNIPTPLESPGDWALTLMDTTYALTASYVPPDLVPVSEAGVRSAEPLRSLVIPDLRRMAAAAAAAGAPISIASGYRSFHNQSVTFRHWENLQGRAAALISSARPGHSEHQLGTAMDFKARGGADPWTYADWAVQTAAGKWLVANAWKYGFIMSYPRGQTAKTCYEYEPWHYRYVGVAEAAAVHSSGLVLRQWLWEHQPNPEVPSP